jgi:putative membrane protein
MTRIIILALALLLFTSGAAFAQGPQPPPSSDTTQAPVGGQDQATIKGNPQNAGPDAEAMSEQDRTFVTKATMGNLVERQTSDVAISQGTERTVEEFAQRMVVDHRNAQEQLGQLASALDMKLPLELDGEHEAMVQRLQSEAGDSFDKQYALLQVQLHREAVELYRTQAEGGQNPELREFAERLLPDLQHHLEMAEAMAEEVAGGATR